MEDLQDKIIELMDLFDDEQVTTADKIDRPQRALDREAIDDFMKRNPMAGGGSIGGGNIEGTPIGNRTGFANVFLDQGKPSRFGPNSDTVVLNGKEYLKITKKGDPNFGKYVYRTSVKTPGYGRSGKSKNEYLTYKQLEKRVSAPKTGKQKFTSYTKGYLAELEDIKKFVNDKGAKNIFLSDLVEMFGDPTKETSDDAVRDPTTEKKIKRAIGDKEYEKLIKGGERVKIAAQKKKDANALVRAVKRGEKPLIALSSELTGEVPNVFKSYLGKVELGMYKSMSPKLKAILSRVTQPRQIYEGTNAIEELKNTTIKTYDKIIKKYPQAQAARTIFTSGKGIGAYNDRSYILSQLFRHVQNGGTKYSYVSGDTTATIKFRNNETGKLITLNNIDVNDPEFKEAADAYNEKERIMNTEIDDPRKKGAKIKIGQAIAANGDSLVIDHLDDVKNNPLKNLAITNQKANMAATIKGATEAELESIGRGLKLSLEDNIKRYSNYARRLLISPDKKRPSPKETIFTKTGTLRGVTDPPDLEIKKLVKTMGDLAATENSECAVDMKALVQRKADGGRIGFKFGTGKPGCDKLAKQIVQKAIQGEGTPQQRSILNKLIRGGANFLKDAVNPVELLKLRNYVGPQALGFFAAYEAGVITDDVLRMGKPLNEAVASNWLTKSFLPYTEEFAKQENLLKSGTLTGEQRLFALDAMKYNKLLKEVERIEGMEAAQLTDQGGYGMIDGKPMVSQAEIDKAMGEVTRIAETIDPAVLDPRSAKAIENKAKMDEMIATRRAKKEFSPIFGFNKLKNRAENVDTSDYLPDPLKIDLSPITYKNAKDFKPVTELPANRRIALENLLLPKDQYKPMDRSLSNFRYKDSDNPFNTILDDELEKYNREQRFKEAFQQPGILGANEKFATGGRAGFKEGTPQSMLRKGILKLIDDSVKKTPKDTTSALDKLIKKTLDEDLFDKKDRIIDQINISEAKKRKNYPYNQQVFEEPKNLDFYDAITKSNFRTKTGPYFDRIRRLKKAGGGLLKQAGDRSGAPPISGPNPQGLQGLLNRVKKV